MTISGGFAEGVLANLRQVRSLSHSCLGGSRVMARSVIRAAIRS
jgi:hypothetical protein